MRAILIVLLAATLSLGGLSGCYESPNTKLYTPGVYKGPKDPLVEKQRDEKQQNVLKARFAQVQTDR